MNKSASLLLCMLLFACASTPVAPEAKLDGAWQSSRELTLQELQRVPDLGAAQLDALSRPDLFGRLIQVHERDRWVIVLEDQCASSLVERLAASADSVTLRYRDQGTGEQRDVKLAFRGDDQLVIPIRQLGDGAGEVFTRVPLAKVKKEHPCVVEALD